MDNSKMIYRRNGKLIYIKQPEISEFNFISKLWADEETMRDIGGTYDFSEDKWENFYDKMVYPGDGKNFYCLIYEVNSNKPVGEVSFHGYDCVTKSARFNIKILYSERRKGYGEEAARLLLEYYFLDFGGKMIIDNVKTDEGIKLIQKLGFEVTGQYKDEVGVRLSHTTFSNINVSTKRSVGILMYDGMNMLDYSVAHDMLKMANECSKNNIFEINGLSFKDKIKTDSGFEICTKILVKKCDIIIIPGCKINKEEINDKKLEFLKDSFKNCDYICAQGSGLKYLIKSRVLEGIFIPKNQITTEDRKFIPERRLIDKAFIDNGKVMLSSNNIGEIESILRLIDKVAGKDVAKKVGINVGVKYE